MRLWTCTSIGFLILLSNRLVKTYFEDFEDTTEIESRLSPDLEENERETCNFYAIVIDAGSTGTRIHLFKFNHCLQNVHSSFVLESETFQEIKPGLSSFAHSPKKAADGIIHLLEMAKNTIPKYLWSHTPITLKATAGLRLLDITDANEIIYQVKKVIFKSGFLIDENSVGILSGVDEGIFGWFTLNYLLQRLHDFVNINNKVDNLSMSQNTAAALDLGGGSTQITFVPKNLTNTLKDFPQKNYRHRLTIFWKNIDFFTHSYLKNGLIEARLEIARLTTHILTSKSNKPENKNVLYTHCLPEDFQLADWDYAGNFWTILSSNSKARFTDCLSMARHYIQEINNVISIPELNNAELYAFSYFYDRALQASLFSTMNTRGLIRVADYADAAKKGQQNLDHS